MKVKSPSTSIILLVSAVNVEPSSTIPSIKSVPIASSSTLTTCWCADWNSVVPPLLSVEIAVNRMY